MLFIANNVESADQFKHSKKEIAIEMRMCVFLFTNLYSFEILELEKKEANFNRK